MFDWLFEGRLTVYLILAIPAVILIALWVRDRKRGWLFGLGVLALFAGVYFLLDRIVETRNEQIGRKLQEMSVAVKKRDTEALFRHISPKFDVGGYNKATFQQAVKTAIELGWADELPIWDVEPPDEKGKVKFRAKPKGNRGDAPPFIIRAQFVKDDDGQWRLQTFEAYNPVVDTEKPMNVGSYLPGGR